MAVAIRRARLSAVAAILLGGVSLAACATTDSVSTIGVHPRYPSRDASRPADNQRSASLPSGQGRYKVGAPYQVRGVWYTPQEDPDYDETGIASWYGDAFHAKATANGETFDMNTLTAAHKTLPLPSIVEVTNLENGRRLQVRVNDRGPFVDGRIIDLSRAAAEELDMRRAGIARVRVRYVGRAPLDAPAETPRGLPPVQLASLPPTLPPVAPAPLSSAALAPVRPEPMPEYVTPEPIETASPPPVEAAPQSPPVSEPPPAEPAPALAAIANYEVQAGAFSNLANAERLAGQLSGTGEAVIRPVQRESGMIYRVVVSRLKDEAEAWTVRERLAGLGFQDAMVIRPF